MLALKLTGLTCIFALILSLILELYFGLTARPYLFGFPRIKWPLFAALALIWVASMRIAYYLVFERRTFFG